MNVVMIIASKRIQFKRERRRVRKDIFAVDVNTARVFFGVGWMEIVAELGGMKGQLPEGWGPMAEYTGG